MSLSATVLDDTVHQLGEGPSWNAERQRVQWVDIDNGRFFDGRLTETETETGLETRVVYQGERTVGAAVHAEDGGYLIADAAHLVRLDADGNRLGERRVIPEGMPSRLNDGACDPAGRYLVGTLAADERPGGELLARLEHTDEVTMLDDDLTISNGLGWSPDGGTFYSIDSVGADGTGTIWVRDYDPDSGRVGERHRFLAIDGTPDGMTVDSVGNLWVAMWGLGHVRCYSPEARLIEVVNVAAPLTTSAALVGPDLTTLVITTASRVVPGVTHTLDSGKLFSVEVPVPGRPTRAWHPAF